MAVCTRPSARPTWSSTPPCATINHGGFADPEQLSRKLESFKRLNQAVLEHLEKVAVAIVAFKDGEPYDIGSGTFVEIEGRCFIATAAHVIDEYPNEALLLITSRERQTDTPLIIGRGSDPVADVGWLELQPGMAQHLGKTPVTLDRLQLGVSHLDDDLAVVYGFPSEKARPHRGATSHGLVVQPICFATHTPDATEQPSDAKPARDIFLAYPDEGLLGPNGPMRGISAPGLSGAGVWTAQTGKQGVWSPDHCKLIAIENSWLRWKYVKCSQVQHFLLLVADSVPELAPTIRAVHPTI